MQLTHAMLEMQNSGLFIDVLSVASVAPPQVRDFRYSKCRARNWPARTGPATHLNAYTFKILKMKRLSTDCETNEDSEVNVANTAVSTEWLQHTGNS